MYRKEFCQIAGIADGYFKQLRAKEMLPFARFAPEGDDAGRVWHEFSVEDAFMLALALDLARAGMSQADASSSVARGYRLIRPLLPMMLLDAGADFWLAAGRVVSQPDQQRGLLSAEVHFCAVSTLPNIRTAPTTLRDGSTLAQAEPHCTGLVFVNINRTLRTMAMRAIAAKTPLDLNELLPAQTEE